MNTIRLVRGLAPVVLLMGAALPSPGQAPASSATFRLFVGLDVEVPFEGEMRPMRRVVNRNRDAEIVANGRVHEVSINRAETLRLKRGMKIARSLAYIENFETNRAYSAANDPYRQSVRAQIAVESQMAERTDLAQAMAVRQLSDGVPNENTAHANTIANRDARLAAADAALMRQVNTTPHYNYGELTKRMSQDLAAEQYDALESVFEINAPDPVADVHLVLVVDYTMPGKKDELRRLVYTRAIGAIGPEARRERIWVQGLPLGYEIKESKVYLYSWGEELATNFSEKPVDLGFDQAVEIMLADHRARHRQSTVPAEPIWLTAPSNFRALIDPAELPDEITIAIDADGRVSSVTMPASASSLSRLPRRVFTETRFLPALENGTPVASTLRVRPAEFLR